MLMLEIADQIERERACDADTIESVRLIVGGVIDDMERHCLGHEGMEDSPVARWVRELREAIKSDAIDAAEAQNPSCADAVETADVTSEAQKVTRDPAEDVSMSAYDLLPADERDAIAWVREHGGLDYVRAEWRSRVPRDRYERRRQRLLGHIAECERALGRRNQRIEELERSLSEAVSAQLASDAALYDLRRELRGQCQAFGVDVSGCEIASEMLHDMNEALSFRLMPEGCEWPRYESGEPVGFGDEVSRLGEVFSISLYCDGSFSLNFRAYSKGERVKRPAVLAADGEPLEVGQTVWDENGDELVIGAIEDGGHTVTCRYAGVGDGIPVHGMWSPSDLTHQRPVLDADGVPIHEGDTVWDATTGARPLTVREIERSDDPDEPEDLVWCGERAANGFRAWRIADQLAHTKPGIDTWERIEEDARGLDSGVDRELFTHTHEDIVRRCKAIAERERGE